MLMFTVCARRVLCVCSDHLLLLISSVDAAESLLEAAVHRPRTCAAAWRVVRAAQASQFASSGLLRVVLVVVLGGLERVGELRDARVRHDACLSMCSGWIWC